MVNQITTVFEAKGPNMIAYLQMAKDLLSHFDSFEIHHVPREANVEADMFSWIGSRIEVDPSCPIISFSQSLIDRMFVNTVGEGEK